MPYAACHLCHDPVKVPDDLRPPPRGTRLLVLCNPCFQAELVRLEQDDDYGADGAADAVFWGLRASPPCSWQLELFA